MRELDEVLAFLLSAVDGAQFAVLASMEGLVVEQHPKEGQDFASYAAEMTHVLTALGRLSDDSMPAGQLRELMVTSERLLSYVKLVSEDIFLAIVMNPSGNLGKARLYSEQVKAELVALLA